MDSSHSPVLLQNLQINGIVSLLVCALLMAVPDQSWIDVSGAVVFVVSYFPALKDAAIRVYESGAASASSIELNAAKCAGTVVALALSAAVMMLALCLRMVSIGKHSPSKVFGNAVHMKIRPLCIISTLCVITAVVLLCYTATASGMLFRSGVLTGSAFWWLKYWFITTVAYSAVAAALMGYYCAFLKVRNEVAI